MESQRSFPVSHEINLNDIQILDKITDWFKHGVQQSVRRDEKNVSLNQDKATTPFHWSTDSCKLMWLYRSCQRLKYCYITGPFWLSQPSFRWLTEIFEELSRNISSRFLCSFSEYGLYLVWKNKWFVSPNHHISQPIWSLRINSIERWANLANSLVRQSPSCPRAGMTYY